jgi:hypothetical protein
MAKVLHEQIRPPEESNWIEALTAVRKHANALNASADARQFVGVWLDGLEAAVRDGPKRSGNRKLTTSAFQAAVCSTLRTRGIAPDEPPLSVVIGGARKTTDVSFVYRRRQWAFEIKLGLEFNSLGAATLEAMAVKQKRESTRFVLLAAYSKFPRDRDPTDHAWGVLQDCGASSAFHSIFVLSRPHLRFPEWEADFVNRLDHFLAKLPGTRRGE